MSRNRTNRTDEKAAGNAGNQRTTRDGDEASGDTGRGVDRRRRPIHRLQNLKGNQAVQRLANADSGAETRAGVEAEAESGTNHDGGSSLQLGEPDDRLEREAERIASQVVASDGGAVRPRRTVRASVQRSSTAAVGGPVPSVVSDVVDSPGRSLEPGVRSRMESHLGADFGSVNVHTGPKAATAAAAIDARAFTVGNDVAFDAGEYAPDTTEGRRVLAHELAHVVQQGGDGTRVQRTRKGKEPATAADLLPDLWDDLDQLERRLSSSYGRLVLERIRRQLHAAHQSGVLAARHVDTFRLLLADARNRGIVDSLDDVQLTLEALLSSRSTTGETAATPSTSTTPSTSATPSTSTTPSTSATPSTATPNRSVRTTANAGRSTTPRPASADAQRPPVSLRRTIDDLDRMQSDVGSVVETISNTFSISAPYPDVYRRLEVFSRRLQNRQHRFGSTGSSNSSSNLPTVASDANEMRTIVAPQIGQFVTDVVSALDAVDVSLDTPGIDDVLATLDRLARTAGVTSDRSPGQGRRPGVQMANVLTGVQGGWSVAATALGNSSNAIAQSAGTLSQWGLQLVTGLVASPATIVTTLASTAGWSTYGGIQIRKGGRRAESLSHLSRHVTPGRRMRRLIDNMEATQRRRKRWGTGTVTAVNVFGWPLIAIGITSTVTGILLGWFPPVGAPLMTAGILLSAFGFTPTAIRGVRKVYNKRKRNPEGWAEEIVQILRNREDGAEFFERFLIEQGIATRTQLHSLASGTTPAARADLRARIASGLRQVRAQGSRFSYGSQSLKRLYADTLLGLLTAGSPTEQFQARRVLRAIDLDPAEILRLLQDPNDGYRKAHTKIQKQIHT